MQSILKVSQQTLWQLLGKAVTSLSTFIILGIIARNYGESGTGIFTLALTYLSIFYLFADFGFNAHILKQFHNEEKLKQDLTFKKLFGTRLIWSVFLVALAVLLLPFFPFEAQFSEGVLFGSLAIVGYATFVTANLFFQSRLRFDLSVISSTVGTFVSLALVYLLVKSNMQISLMLLAQMIGWMVIGTSSLIVLHRFIKPLVPVFDLSFIKSLFKDSWPIALTLAVNTVYFRADVFILAFFKPTEVVGIYNVAYQIFQTALVVPTFIMNAYYPLMLNLYKTNFSFFVKQVRIASFGLIVLGALATILTLILSPLIIRLVTGGGFVGATTALNILSLGFPAYFLSSLLMWVLVVTKKYKSMLLVYTLGLLFNVSLNLIFIPQFSYIAASWITVLSECLVLVFQIVIILKGFKQ